MGKRISMTLSDDMYAALVKAMGKQIVEAGVSLNVTEYIKRAITAMVCRDLEINQVSDIKE